jgi:hypothetical protein
LRVRHPETGSITGQVASLCRSRSISTRWLSGYLIKWVWKWNHRYDDEAMFRTLLDNAAQTD